jgi:hypothetical protein
MEKLHSFPPVDGKCQDGEYYAVCGSADNKQYVCVGDSGYMSAEIACSKQPFTSNCNVSGGKPAFCKDLKRSSLSGLFGGSQQTISVNKNIAIVSTIAGSIAFVLMLFLSIVSSRQMGFIYSIFQLLVLASIAIMVGLQVVALTKKE